MNTRQLEYVMAVAQERSFSEAAKRLMISQPSLSQYIQKLEQELGALLFERTSPLRLTYAGEVYVATARKILETEREMQRVITDIADEKTGRIVVAAGPLNSSCLLPQVIRRFYEEYPNVKMTVREMVEPEIFDHVRHGDVDLAVTTMPVSGGEFTYLPIAQEDFLLAVPRSYEINRRYANAGEAGVLAEVDLLECEPYPFITLNPKLQLHKVLDSLCEESGLQINKAVECGSVMGAYFLVCAGVGVAMLPSTAMKFQLDRSSVCYYKVRQCRQKRGLGLFYQKNKYLTKAMTRLIEILSAV